MLPARFFNTAFHTSLENVQIQRPDLTLAWIKVIEIYHYYDRSLRRGAVLQAKQLNYDQRSITDTNNRWRRMQGTRGKASLPMGQLYLHIILSLNTHKRF